ncbi:MAG: pyruvate formate-lyase-activating protein [Bacilli bacterium]
MSETIGYIDSIESFGLVDGPGVRSVLFLVGCPFRCLYCHNPETWTGKGKMQLTPEQAFQLLYRFHPYWRDNGGITISGGEPLLQIDFLLELAKIAKKNHVSVTIDTSGATFQNNEDYLKKFDELLSYCSLFMVDIKSIDLDTHIKITGKGNENVIEMFHYLDQKNFPIWIRHVLVPGLTDDDSMLKRTGQFIASLHNVQRVEVLPYHSLMIPKYQKLGIPYPLMDTPIPLEERIKNAETLLGCEQYQKYLGGK